MRLFGELKETLKTYLCMAQIERVYQAYQFAAKAHAGQQRQNGDPYITHPLAVAQILASMRIDTQTLIVALLHDVIEDTPIEKKTLIDIFGIEIAELVEGMSKLTQIQFQSRAIAQAENFRKMLLAMAKDIRIIIIKLADRLHNMRTLDVVSSEKQRRIAKETLDIYAPIAQRLGMHAIRVEMEDLCLRNLHPWRYSILQTILQKSRRKSHGLIHQIESELGTCLQKNLPYPVKLWHKKKHLYPIYKKMRENHLTFNEVIDIPIFCIVVEDIDQCYRALGAVHNRYKPLPDHFHDYIALPKANGYQALHTTLFGPTTSIHVQIRTTQMDNCAEHGIASYWLDQNKESEHPHLRAREWLKRLLDIQQTTSSSLEFIESVKIDLFPTDIYIFTPKGDIIELPQKATPIDFAYAIHSDIGHHCIATKINKQLALLSTPLQSGQTIEIITDPNALPDLGWLDFVVTGRARSHIRQFFKSKHHNDAVQLGQRLLDNALIPFGKDIAHLPIKQLNKMLAKFQYASLEELFEALGLGQVHPLSIATSLFKARTKPEQQIIHPLPLFLKNNENSLMSCASCCLPIPEDEIVGVLTAGQGILVHRARCLNANKMFKKEKNALIPLKWEKTANGFFKTEILIETINRSGMLAQLTHCIAKADTNIDNIQIKPRDSIHCVMHFILLVRNRKHLAKVIRLLRMIKPFIKITRHVPTWQSAE